LVADHEYIPGEEVDDSDGPADDWDAETNSSLGPDNGKSRRARRSTAFNHM